MLDPVLIIKNINFTVIVVLYNHLYLTQLTSSKEFANIMENMVSRASVGGHQQRLDLPPGFRFYPTDEELVVHYLKNKVSSRPLPVSIIAEIDLYKFDPWDLPGKAIYCAENEWYFFTPRERKYPNGARPNRAAGSGYWKATGTDKPIVSCGSLGAQGRSGVKKALVFYTGRPPKGVKTNWIMHEYRLAPDNPTKTTPFSSRRSLRLDDWVLCRIYQKSGGHTARVHRGSESNSCVEEVFASLPDQYMQQEVDAGTQLYNGTRQLPSMGSLSRFIEEPVSDPFLVDSLHVADQASSASVNNLASPNSTIINEPRNSWTNLALFDSTHLPNTIMKYQAPYSMTSEHPTSLFARDIHHHGRKRTSNMPNNNMNHSNMDLNGLHGSIFPPMHHHHQQLKAQCNNTHNGGGEMADSATLRWPFVDGRPKFPYA